MLGGYNFEDRIEVTVCDGNGLFLDIIDKVLMTMKKGEHAYIRISVNAVRNEACESPKCTNALKFNIFLESFERSTDIEDMCWRERIELAERHMDKASELFKKREFRRAIWKYETAFAYLGLAVQSEEPPIKRSLQNQPLIVQCHLNIAQVMFELRMYEKVTERCKAVLELDDESTRGLLLQGQAHYELCEYRDAKADFVSVLHIEPQNIEAQKMITLIDSIVKRPEDTAI